VSLLLNKLLLVVVVVVILLLEEKPDSKKLRSNADDVFVLEEGVKSGLVSKVKLFKRSKLLVYHLNHLKFKEKK
jgi:hypothetical protein